MMAAVGCLTYEFQVSLPGDGEPRPARGRQRLRLHDRRDGHRRGRRRPADGGPGQDRTAAAGARGVGIRRRDGICERRADARASSWPPSPFVGGASITFMSTGNSTLQLTAEPAMRGRVMSLWFVAFQGSTPIGGPVVGVVMGRARRARRPRSRRRHLPGGGAGGRSSRSRGAARRQERSVELQHAANVVEPVDQPPHVRGACCAPRRTLASSPIRPACASAAARNDARRGRRPPGGRGSRRCRGGVHRRARRRSANRDPPRRAVRARAVPGPLSRAARGPRRRAAPRGRGSARSRVPGSNRPPPRVRSPRRSATSRPRTSTAGRSTSIRWQRPCGSCDRRR